MNFQQAPDKLVWWHLTDSGRAIGRYTEPTHESTEMREIHTHTFCFFCGAQKQMNAIMKSIQIILKNMCQ